MVAVAGILIALLCSDYQNISESGILAGIAVHPILAVLVCQVKAGFRIVFHGGDLVSTEGDLDGVGSGAVQTCLFAEEVAVGNRLAVSRIEAFGFHSLGHLLTAGEQGMFPVISQIVVTVAIPVEVAGGTLFVHMVPGSNRFGDRILVAVHVDTAAAMEQRRIVANRQAQKISTAAADRTDSTGFGGVGHNTKAAGDAAFGLHFKQPVQMLQTVLGQTAGDVVQGEGHRTAGISFFQFFAGQRIDRRGRLGRRSLRFGGGRFGFFRSGRLRGFRGGSGGRLRGDISFFLAAAGQQQAQHKKHTE